MAQIRIRPGTVADGPALGDAHATAWKVAYGDLFDPRFVEDAAESRRVAWPDAIVGLLVPPSFILVAEIDGRVLAYAHAQPSTDAGEGVAELRGFFAHPDAWGSGSATLLLDATCSRLAETHDDVVLWTFAGASRARAFYEKVGFRLTGRENLEGPSNWLTGETREQASVEYRMSLHGWKP